MDKEKEVKFKDVKYFPPSVTANSFIVALDVDGHIWVRGKEWERIKGPKPIEEDEEPQHIPEAHHEGFEEYRGKKS